MSNHYQTYQDAQLYALLQTGGAGKNHAFAELYRRYHQRMYAYILKVTGNSDDTKDIFQETFFRLMRSAEHANEVVENVGGFLMRTARNLCLNYKRDRKDNIPVEDYHLVHHGAPGYEQEELLRLIQTALECLDFDYREAFVLRLYHDLSYEEIADLTQTTIPTIKNRVWRAKEKIRSILAPILADFDKL